MMRMDRRAFLGVSGASAAAACAHEPALLTDLDREPDLEIPLWPDAPPGGTPAGLHEYLEERTNPFNLRDRAARDVTRPLLSLFRSGNPDGAAILIVPGGGYRWAVVDKEGYEGARWFSQLGAHVYVLRYRLPHQGWAAGRYAPLQDAQRAMRIIRARADDDGISPDRVMVMGFSAGGHLAGSLCVFAERAITAPTDEIDALPATPNAAALIYPVVTMRAPYAHAGSRTHLLGAEPDDAAVAEMSLDEQSLSGFPSAFLMHAQDDEAVPVENTLRLHDALRRAGKRPALHIFENGGHGFGLRGIESQPLRRWPGLVYDWALAHGIFVPGRNAR
jgi:acetyl esterase/lipase